MSQDPAPEEREHPNRPPYADVELLETGYCVACGGRRWILLPIPRHPLMPCPWCRDLHLAQVLAHFQDQVQKEIFLAIQKEVDGVKT